MLLVNLQINEAHTKMGEGVYVIGNIPQLGNWDAKNAVKLYTAKDLYPCWKKATKISEGISVPASQQRPFQFSDNMVQLGLEAPGQSVEMTERRVTIMEEEEPLYLDLGQLKQREGDEFVIEYKYCVKNTNGNIFWEHGKVNRQIKASELINLFNQMILSGQQSDHTTNILVIEDQIYNDLAPQRKMYWQDTRCQGNNSNAIPDIPMALEPHELKWNFDSQDGREEYKNPVVHGKLPVFGSTESQNNSTDSSLDMVKQPQSSIDTYKQD